ncbi:hypothetical protein CK203_039139 [Vitis vinifera]|uniref:Uncharacterized protein n=1 Tax=Vitis vinifera TaxID=29760 RepID=A0A438IFK8_VITVI|nr:hypothetical protein CK203_039139 [Vitis vinifera]
MADRATCIVFSNDDLPPEGSDHVHPYSLMLLVQVVGCRLSCWTTAPPNVCPLVTAIALGFSSSDFGPSTQTVRAYDGTQRTVMGTLTTHVMIRVVRYSILFQKVKFIHEGRIITIQSDKTLLPLLSHVTDQSHTTTLWYQYDERHVLYAWLGIGSPPAGVASLLSQLIMTYHMDWVTLLLRRMHDTWHAAPG